MFICPYARRWGFIPLLLSKVVSFELDPLFHSDRGVVNRLFLSLYWSYRPIALCEGSQEVLLRNYIGGFSQLCQLWPAEALKVGGTSL